MSDDRATFSGCFTLEVNYNNRLHNRSPRQTEDVPYVQEVAQEFWEFSKYKEERYANVESRVHTSCTHCPKFPNTHKTEIEHTENFSQEL